MTPRPSTLVDASRSRAGGALGHHLVVMGEAGVRDGAARPLRGQVIVGRGSDADVRVAEPRASRRHARLILGDDIRVEDLASANGTRVRGRKLDGGQARRRRGGRGDLDWRARAHGPARSWLGGAPRRAAARRARGADRLGVRARAKRRAARSRSRGSSRTRARPSPASPGAVLRAVDVVGRCGLGELGLLLPGSSSARRRSRGPARSRRRSRRGRAARASASRRIRGTAGTRRRCSRARACVPRCPRPTRPRR